MGWKGGESQEVGGGGGGKNLIALTPYPISLKIVPS